MPKTKCKTKANNYNKEKKILVSYSCATAAGEAMHKLCGQLLWWRSAKFGEVNNSLTLWLGNNLLSSSFRESDNFSFSRQCESERSELMQVCATKYMLAWCFTLGCGRESRSCQIRSDSCCWGQLSLEVLHCCIDTSGKQPVETSVTADFSNVYC